jgi:kynurenine formamidase
VPDGYAEVDPRSARRVALTLSLRAGAPVYPGDPPFEYDPAFLDTRTRGQDDGGYLLERVTSLGTHTASSVSAPLHFVLGGTRLDQLDEQFTLMPLAVVDVRRRMRRTGADFFVEPGDLRRWERRHGSIPAGGCVLLLTGNSRLWEDGSGQTSPYVTRPIPGFSGTAVDWLFTERRILATGADALGPDATKDARLQAATRTHVHGGIVLENVGPGLAEMRPRGDWIAVNGNRPPFSGFPAGFTGFTLPGRSARADHMPRGPE